MDTYNKKKLGELLIENKLITKEQLEAALKIQKEKGGQLGAILIDLGYIDEEAAFLHLVAKQHDVDHIQIQDMDISNEIINKIPPRFVTHYKIMPVKLEGNILTVATARPLDIQTLDELNLVVKERLKPILAGEKDILEGIRKYYGVGAETIQEMMGQVQSPQDIQTIDQIDESDAEASVSKFLNQILLEAFNDRASDIHIEPFEDELQIRYRIDGVLKDAQVPINIRHFKDSIISRIKILSNLNIAEKRKPQDGRFKVKVKNADLDFRVSFLPTPYGESVVLRILNATSLLSFDQLGMEKKEQEILNKLIQKPHGIIFLTGPTGSGKTTTLYSCLAQVNTDDTKIITIEDPIEYQLKGVTQIQINPEIGLTFAQGLRSMLRHDPDVMMVGEVRDKETADIAIQASLTGHLMFSTLHTNDAASGVTRLLDMGVEPYLITSTVDCFIAQRLIRLLCPKCKQSAAVNDEILKESQGQIDLTKKDIIYEAVGCKACNSTGYSGRSGIHEFLQMTDPIRDLIMQRVTSVQIKRKAVEEGMKTLAQVGWQKVKEGKTSAQEVMRVTKDDFVEE